MLVAFPLMGIILIIKLLGDFRMLPYHSNTLANAIMAMHDFSEATTASGVPLSRHHYKLERNNRPAVFTEIMKLNEMLYIWTGLEHSRSLSNMQLIYPNVKAASIYLQIANA